MRLHPYVSPPVKIMQSRAKTDSALAAIVDAGFGFHTTTIDVSNLKVTHFIKQLTAIDKFRQHVDERKASCYIIKGIVRDGRPTTEQTLKENMHAYDWCCRVGCVDGLSPWVNPMTGRTHVFVVIRQGNLA
jgi:hypothetical protein